MCWLCFDEGRKSSLGCKPNLKQVVDFRNCGLLAPPDPPASSLKTYNSISGTLPILFAKQEGQGLSRGEIFIIYGWCNVNGLNNLIKLKKVWGCRNDAVRRSEWNLHCVVAVALLNVKQSMTTTFIHVWKLNSRLVEHALMKFSRADKEKLKTCD